MRLSFSISQSAGFASRSSSGSNRNVPAQAVAASTLFSGLSTLSCRRIDRLPDWVRRYNLPFLLHTDPGDGLVWRYETGHLYLGPLHRFQIVGRQGIRPLLQLGVAARLGSDHALCIFQL